MRCHRASGGTGEEPETGAVRGGAVSPHSAQTSRRSGRRLAWRRSAAVSPSGLSRCGGRRGRASRPRAASAFRPPAPNAAPARRRRWPRRRCRCRAARPLSSDARASSCSSACLALAIRTASSSRWAACRLDSASSSAIVSSSVFSCAGRSEVSFSSSVFLATSCRRIESRSPTWPWTSPLFGSRRTVSCTTPPPIFPESINPAGRVGPRWAARALRAVASQGSPAQVVAAGAR
jgi:hypothetical protein